MRRIRRVAALWFAMGLIALPAALPAVEQTCTVKRGDTVFGIARSCGVSSSALAERNGLSRNYYLSIGQKLVIPAKQPARPAAAKPARPSAAAAPPRIPRPIQRAIDRAPVRPGRWQYIVIHHSGVDTGTMKAMDHYHREVRHMENGLAYHFVIGNGSGMGDGEIAISRRWTLQLDGGHLASEAQDRVALGICLVGNFDLHKPDARQLESLRALVDALLARCRLSPDAVKVHQQINIVHTRCPGTNFPTATFLNSLKPPPPRK